MRWFCSSRRWSRTSVSHGGPDQAEMADLEQQALLQIARADANRIELLHVIERPLDRRDVPVAERRDLVHRGHQVAVVVDVADDRGADVAQRLVAPPAG